MSEAESPSGIDQMTQLMAEIQKLEEQPQNAPSCWPTPQKMEEWEREEAESKKQQPHMPEDLKDFTDKQLLEFLANPPGFEDVGGISQVTPENYYDHKEKSFYPIFDALMAADLAKGEGSDPAQPSWKPRRRPTDPMPPRTSPKLTRLELLKQSYGPEFGQFLEDNWESVCASDRNRAGKTKSK
ncbi:MAG: hypothetical protein LQ342_002355 [Letrouitia transgressa]|nr:MAG: hypothetical protein LQ342_002355 [Letrouitia transgressa]